VNLIQTSILACCLVACSNTTNKQINNPKASSASNIKAHMSFLADDLLEGREAGTRGEAIAGLYIATEYKRLGLEPAGNDGTYFQEVPLIASTVDLHQTILKVKHQEHVISFNNGTDMIAFGDSNQPEINIAGEMVFVGHGISAPELGHDDYAELDVTGKIVVVLGGPPAFLPSAEAAHLGAKSEKAKTAMNKGAVGLISIYTPSQEALYAFDNFRQRLTQPTIDSINQAAAIPTIRINVPASTALFSSTTAEVKTLIDQSLSGPVNGFELNASASFRLITSHEHSIKSSNIAAIIKGADSDLAKETIVVTAHYDHVGICRPETADDRICNGALDNAFGVAAMLDVARILSQPGQSLPRSVLFLAVGAEEKGLLGSEYFAEHPTIPSTSIIANVNMDGGLPFYEFSDVIAFGAEQSELGQHLASSIAPLGLTVAADPFPEESIFTRSDQYSFVKKGIPALFLYNGFTNLEGENIGLAIWNGSLGNHYHAPTDDLSLPIDYQVTAKYADVFHRLISEVAHAPARPLWYADSIFGQRFSPNSPKASHRKTITQ